MWRAIVLLLALTVSGCASRGTRIPNKTMGGAPGPLEQQYAALAHPDQSEPPSCNNDVPTGVTEIAIEHTPCYGLCSTYTFTIKSDGTATYYGQGNVEFVGTRKGSVDPQLFQELARLALDLGIDQMNDLYTCGITDNPTIYLSIVHNGQRKLIKHYAPDMTGPPRLQWFESYLSQVEDRVKWEHR